MGQMGITPGQFWGAIFALGVSILGTMVKMHLQNRKDAREDREKQRDRDVRWETILKEHPVHSHCDPGKDDVKLSKGNIRYAKPTA
jgi:siroheme synthase (precorrin-2 oxidase/ferrochelatase)